MTGTPFIVYVNRLESVRPLAEGEVEQAVRAVAEAEGIARGEVSITFLGIEAMIALNVAHLHQSSATDVIAFNLGSADTPLGDVYVCPDVAAESARELGLSLREELLRLVIHGTLHVFGHTHPEGPERTESEMFRRQEAILSGIL